MKNKVSLVLMIMLMGGAGLFHLVIPDVFLPAIPPFFPYPQQIILLTGLLEILLALFLIFKKSRDFAAKTIALYLLLLLPIHIYVAFFGIEIFGVNNKFVLWIRTFFQFVLYFWALSLQTKSWMIEQVWNDVSFLHFKISPDEIKKLVPFELDLYEEKAIVSIVPFFMDNIRFPFLPPIPRLSRLNELNIRTYITVNGVKGVYFFTLETDSKIGEWVARHFFHLPYRFSKIKTSLSNNQYHFLHEREAFHFQLDAIIQNENQTSHFDTWATERYSLFTKKGEVVYQGIVIHAPWKLKCFEIIHLKDQFTSMLTQAKFDLVGTAYSKSIKVRFLKFSTSFLEM